MLLTCLLWAGSRAHHRGRQRVNGEREWLRMTLLPQSRHLLAVQHCMLHLCSLLNWSNVLARAYSVPGTAGAEMEDPSLLPAAYILVGWPACKQAVWVQCDGSSMEMRNGVQGRLKVEWPPPSRRGRQEMLSGGPGTSAETWRMRRRSLGKPGGLRGEE